MKNTLVIPEVSVFDSYLKILDSLLCIGVCISESDEEESDEELEFIVGIQGNLISITKTFKAYFTCNQEAAPRFREYIKNTIKEPELIESYVNLFNGLAGVEDIFTDSGTSPDAMFN